MGSTKGRDSAGLEALTACWPLPMCVAISACALMLLTPPQSPPKSFSCPFRHTPRLLPTQLR